MSAQDGVDVRRDRRAVLWDYVAVLQRGTATAARDQLDVLLADGRHAVYLGCEVGGDLDLRIQRQHCLDAGVGQVDAVHSADLRAAIGDIAPRIQPSGLGQLKGHAILPDAQHLGQPHVAEDHDRKRRDRHEREDRYLDEYPSRQNHVRAPDPIGRE